MLCPNCKVPLTMSDRQGVEVDYCPQCRGVWLDRGELDKIVERSASYGPPSRTESPMPDRAPVWGPGGRRDDDDDDDYYDRGGYPRRRRRGWLGDLFDFD